MIILLLKVALRRAAKLEFVRILNYEVQEDSTHVSLQTASLKGIEPEVKKWPPRADDSQGVYKNPRPSF